MNLGTVVFTDEVIGHIVRVELRDGRVIVTVDVPQPHPAFDANRWRVHGADGSVIYTVKNCRRPVMVKAMRCGGTTTVWCPLSIDGGTDIEDRPPLPPLPGEGKVEYA